LRAFIFLRRNDIDSGGGQRAGDGTEDMDVHVEHKAHSEADGRPRRRRASGESVVSRAAVLADSMLLLISASMEARSS
jgi:hypothetical protein